MEDIKVIEDVKPRLLILIVLYILYDQRLQGRCQTVEERISEHKARNSSFEARCKINKNYLPASSLCKCEDQETFEDMHSFSSKNALRKPVFKF